MGLELEGREGGEGDFAMGEDGGGKIPYNELRSRDSSSYCANREKGNRGMNQRRSAHE